MKKLIFLCFLLTSFGVNAQDFKEGIIYDVTGPVKDVVLTSESIYPTFLDKASFGKDGKRVNSRSEFDENGYPMGWSLDSDALSVDDNGTLGSFDLSSISDLGENGKRDLKISYNICYDDSHRVASTNMTYYIDIDVMDMQFSNNMTDSRSFKYIENKLGKPEISEINSKMVVNGENCTADYQYSGYVYDDHGNWVARNVVETITFPELEKTNKYTETRAITYFD